MIRTVALYDKLAPVGSAGQWPLVRKPEVVASRDRFEHVRYLQQFCNAAGFAGANGRPLTVDGQPGPQTMHAVASAQAVAGITTERGRVGPWTWLVVDQAMYDGWTACAPTRTSIGDRGPAIWKGRNRYTGLVVDRFGIARENQYHSDVARAAVAKDWRDDFVAVDRYQNGTRNPSKHRLAFARDWMVDLDKDGNYREPAEVAKTDAVADYLAGRAMGWPMQTVTFKVRGDGAKGIDDTTARLSTVTMRFSGPDRLAKIVWNGEILEWRRVNGVWRLDWWPLKPTSDQHRNHAHSEVAPIIDGVLAA